MWIELKVRNGKQRLVNFNQVDTMFIKSESQCCFDFGKDETRVVEHSYEEVKQKIEDWGRIGSQIKHLEG